MRLKEALFTVVKALQSVSERRILSILKTIYFYNNYDSYYGAIPETALAVLGITLSIRTGI